MYDIFPRFYISKTGMGKNIRICNSILRKRKRSRWTVKCNGWANETQKRGRSRKRAHSIRKRREGEGTFVFNVVCVRANLCVQHAVVSTRCQRTHFSLFILFAFKSLLLCIYMHFTLPHIQITQRNFEYTYAHTSSYLSSWAAEHAYAFECAFGESELNLKATIKMSFEHKIYSMPHAY